MARRDCLSPKRKERTKVYIISFSQAFFCIHYLPFIYHLLTFDQEKSSTPAHRRTKTASISNGHTSSMGKRSRAPHCIYLISFIFFTSFVSFPCLSLSLSLSFFFFFFLILAIKQRVANYEIDKVHEPALHKAGVYIYIECELIAKKYAKSYSFPSSSYPFSVLYASIF